MCSLTRYAIEFEFFTSMSLGPANWIRGTPFVNTTRAGTETEIFDFAIKWSWSIWIAKQERNLYRKIYLDWLRIEDTVGCGDGKGAQLCFRLSRPGESTDEAFSQNSWRVITSYDGDFFFMGHRNPIRYIVNIFIEFLL